MQVPFAIDTPGAAASSRRDRPPSADGAADTERSDFRAAFDETTPPATNETDREAPQRDISKASAAPHRTEEPASSASRGTGKNGEGSVEEVDETAATKTSGDTVKNDPASAIDTEADLLAITGLSTATTPATVPPPPRTTASSVTQTVPTEAVAAVAGTTAKPADSDMTETPLMPPVAGPRQQPAGSVPNASLPASSTPLDTRPTITTGGTAAQPAETPQAEDTALRSDRGPSASKDAKAVASLPSAAAAQATAALPLPGTKPEPLSTGTEARAAMSLAVPRDGTTNRSVAEIADNVTETAASKEVSNGPTTLRQGDGMQPGREAAQSQTVVAAARAITSGDPDSEHKGDRTGHASIRRENTSTTPTAPAIWHATAAQPDTITTAQPIAGAAIDNQASLDASRADATTAVDSGASERSGSDQIRASENARHTATPTLADTPRTAMRQIAESLHRASDGSVHLTLSPEELGRVRLSLTPGDHGITVNISADRIDTLELMRRHGDMLTNAMRDLGYGEVVLDFAGRQNDSSGQGRGFAAGAAAPSEESTEMGLSSTTRTSPGTAGGGLDLRL
ncbi:flagellar hook-length control protein FliK [Rhodovulum sp. MB263]|uniref:flagellar hook-length control protein FliK n=1 Tax=Rhodovulum sp. (strain MB263) TaxID=308754 RepID=UPI0012DB38E1|nr:flagellar hook-length control protein FliK [Rhodovulum sp. MB263]